MNNQVSTSKPFDILNDDDGGHGGITVVRLEKKATQTYDKQDSYEEEVVEVYNETNDFMTSGRHPSSSRARASSSSTKGSNG
ncbi:hypothetical protein Hanom_Chr00s003522g01713181 [Helianthus anomalus]